MNRPMVPCCWCSCVLPMSKHAPPFLAGPSGHQPATLPKPPAWLAGAGSSHGAHESRDRRRITSSVCVWGSHLGCGRIGSIVSHQARYPPHSLIVSNQGMWAEQNVPKMSSTQLEAYRNVLAEVRRRERTRRVRHAAQPAENREACWDSQANSLEYNLCAGKP